MLAVDCSWSVECSCLRKESRLLNQCRAAQGRLRLLYSVVDGLLLWESCLSTYENQTIRTSVGLMFCHIHPESVKLSEVDLRMAFGRCCNISITILQQTTSRTAAWHALVGMRVLGLITQLPGCLPGAAPPFASFSVGPNTLKQLTDYLCFVSNAGPVLAGCDPAER